MCVFFFLSFLKSDQRLGRKKLSILFFIFPFFYLRPRAWKWEIKYMRGKNCERGNLGYVHTRNNSSRNFRGDNTDLSYKLRFLAIHICFASQTLIALPYTKKEMTDSAMAYHDAISLRFALAHEGLSIVSALVKKVNE